MKATVLGAGSWGTTFSQVLWDAGTPAVLWARDAVIADSVNASHENPRYLPGISLPPGLTATTSAALAFRQWASSRPVPSAFTRSPRS